MEVHEPQARTDWFELGAVGERGRGLVHCHSEDEEIYVVLEGNGTLVLVPTPQMVHWDGRGRDPVRAGHVISRRPGTGIAQGLRAGKDGMTFLAYGTRKPGDICYYPRSNKIYFRGLGLIARLEGPRLRRRRAGLGGEPAKRAASTSIERDVLLGRELVRRMADAAVETADEQHPGVDAGCGEDARVVTGARR